MNWHCEFRHPFGLQVGTLQAGNCPQEAIARALPVFLGRYASEPGFVPENSHAHLDSGRPVGATRNRPPGMTFELVFHRDGIAQLIYRVVVREVSPQRRRV